MSFPTIPSYESDGAWRVAIICHILLIPARAEYYYLLLKYKKLLLRYATVTTTGQIKTEFLKLFQTTPKYPFRSFPSIPNKVSRSHLTLLIFTINTQNITIVVTFVECAGLLEHKLSSNRLYS